MAHSGSLPPPFGCRLAPSRGHRSLICVAFARVVKNKTKPMVEWVREDYPQIKEFVYECTQIAGDVVYVSHAHFVPWRFAAISTHTPAFHVLLSYAPGYFDHAIINTQLSLGVAIQVGSPIALGTHVARFIKDNMPER